jgi:cytochrome c oxidase subunit 2
LAGQQDWYLVRQLQNYKSGIRGSQPKDTYGVQMKPMASMLANDAAMNDVVAYIDTLK